MRHWREHAGFTQEQAAEVIGVSHATIQRIENGKQVTPIDNIEALARLYKTDVHSMLNRLPTVPANGRPEFDELADMWSKASQPQRKLIARLARNVLETNSN